MLIILISSAIASWLWVVPGGFWLVGNGFSWFAVLVVMVANQLFAFCLTILLVLASLDPALKLSNIYGSIIMLIPKTSYFVVTFCRSFLVSSFG